jgi:putative ABC transport system permease protein
MSALLTKILGDLRRRRLQAFVIFIIVLLTAGVGTLGVEMLSGASAPFDSAFEQKAGAHALVLFHDTVKDASVLAPTTRLPNVTASAGPWLSGVIPFAFGTAKGNLRVIGRTDPGGAVDRLHLVAGRWVEQVNEIVLTRSFAEKVGLAVGDRLTAISRSDAPTLTVVGEVVDIDEADASLQTLQYAWVVPQQVAGLLPAGTTPNYLMLYRFRQAATAADLQRNIDEIAAVLSPNSIAYTLTYLVVKQLFSVNTLIVLGSLLAFAAFALGAVALIIANVVTGAVLASYREIGVIKALGFTPGQVVLTFVGQMLLPALAGCIIGVPLGVLGSIPLLNSSYQALDLPPTTLLSPIPALLAALGILLIVALFAALPALRAGLLNPVTAITRGTAPGPQRRSRLAALLQRVGLPRTLSLGAGDAFARPVRGLLTALAVLVAVATLTFASGVQASFQRVVIPGVFPPADITVARYGDYPDSNVMQTLQAQPETLHIVASSFTSVQVAGLSSPVNTQPMRGSSLADGYLLSDGRWFNGPGEAVGGLAFVQEAHLKVGDSFTATLNNHTLNLRLVGIYYDTSSFGRTLRFDWSSYLEMLPDAQPDQYTVTLRAGADLQAYARRVSATAPDFLSVQARTAGALALIDIANTVLAILAVVLGAIAIAGVFNTMLLNTRERMQDIATLKALGMTPGQVVGMVVSSACVLGLLGGALGVPVGMWLHHTLIDLSTRAIGDPLPASFYQGAFDNLAVLVLLALGGMVAALLGAALPARTAARHSVVEALRAE